MASGSNPFNSRQLRPGAIDYIFPPGDSLDALLQRLRDHRWRGQIVGPHGTGKSTLLHGLLPRLRALGWTIVLGSFQGGDQHWKILTAKDEAAVSPGTRRERKSALKQAKIVIIDGFEQLSPMARSHWKWYCRWTRRGLIVTAHRSVGLPEAARTALTPPQAIEIVNRLAGETARGFSESEIIEAFKAHRGNMRETLFTLYDAYESRRAHSRTTSSQN